MRATARRDVLVLAELNPDVIVTCADAPVFGQVEQLVTQARLVLGSSGAITAAALAARGVDAAVCATVGADELGVLTTRLLGEYGVDTSLVLVRPGVSTGMTVVLARPDGDRALLTFPGSMAELRTADVPPSRLTEVSHVHVSSFYLQTSLHPGLPELLGAARAAGATTSLDPGWDPADEWSALAPALPYLDYLLPNAAECAKLAHRLGCSSQDPLEAARFLSSLGPGVALKLGPQGAAWITQGEQVRQPGRPVPVVDTTGAGDNFNAGFLAGCLAGASPERALTQGIACGAAAVTAVGGTGHLTRHAQPSAAHGDPGCAVADTKLEDSNGS